MNMELVSYPGEQSVEAVDFLPLRDVGVVLSNALQGQLLHQVYLIGFLKVLGLQQGHTQIVQGKKKKKIPDSQLTAGTVLRSGFLGWITDTVLCSIIYLFN